MNWLEHAVVRPTGRMFAKDPDALDALATLEEVVQPYTIQDHHMEYGATVTLHVRTLLHPDAAKDCPHVLRDNMMKKMHRLVFRDVYDELGRLRNAVRGMHPESEERKTVESVMRNLLAICQGDDI